MSKNFPAEDLLVKEGNGLWMEPRVVLSRVIRKMECESKLIMSISPSGYQLKALSPDYKEYTLS